MILLSKVPFITSAASRRTGPFESGDRSHPQASTVGQSYVLILGPHPLQGQLLAAYIHSCTGMNAQAKTVDAWRKDRTKDSERCRLYLIDGAAGDESIPWPESSPMIRFPMTMAALFNIEPHSGIESRALQRGIRGVFYKQDDAETVIKGIKAMMSGELWFSRKVSSQLLWNNRNNWNENAISAERLTQRETEILGQLASGCSNQRIADVLSISLHTVKTHLHNTTAKLVSTTA
jgi:DNA-binding CsgD family transcriptional regulator